MKPRVSRINFSQGAQNGGFIPIFIHAGQKHHFFKFSTNGRLRISFRFLRLKLNGKGLPDSLKELVSNESDGEVELKLDRKLHPVGGVLDALQAHGARIEDIHTREPTLEDIFVELTHEAAHG